MVEPPVLPTLCIFYLTEKYIKRFKGLVALVRILPKREHKKYGRLCNIGEA